MRTGFYGKPELALDLCFKYVADVATETKKKSVTDLHSIALEENWQTRLLQSCAKECKLIIYAKHWVSPNVVQINCSVKGEKIILVYQKA